MNSPVLTSASSLAKVPCLIFGSSVNTVLDSEQRTVLADGSINLMNLFKIDEICNSDIQ